MKDLLHYLADLQLGYLPEAVVNWSALMGWSYDDHTEFFTCPTWSSSSGGPPQPAPDQLQQADHFNGCTCAAWQSQSGKAPSPSSRRLATLSTTFPIETPVPAASSP
jgi:hypothetical protein